MQPLLCFRMTGSAARAMYTTIKVGLDQRLESLRAQLLEGCDIGVARVVHDYIETPERLHGRLHCSFGRILIGHAERSRAHLIAVFFHQIIDAPRIARRGQQAISLRDHRFR